MACTQCIECQFCEVGRTKKTFRCMQPLHAPNSIGVNGDLMKPQPIKHAYQRKYCKKGVSTLVQDIAKQIIEEHAKPTPQLSAVLAVTIGTGNGHVALPWKVTPKYLESLGVDEATFQRAFRKAKLANDTARRRALDHGVRYEFLAYHIAGLFCTIHQCHYCGKQLRLAEKTVDHAIPLSHGGGHIRGNVVVACKDCNDDKANMDKLQYMATLYQRIKRMTVAARKARA